MVNSYVALVPMLFASSVSVVRVTTGVASVLAPDSGPDMLPGRAEAPLPRIGDVRRPGPPLAPPLVLVAIPIANDVARLLQAIATPAVLDGPVKLQRQAMVLLAGLTVPADPLEQAVATPRLAGLNRLFWLVTLMVLWRCIVMLLINLIG